MKKQVLDISKGWSYHNSSGFWPGHLTETAVVQVSSDILQVVDCGNSAALVLLDLSAAFDTVDHEILLQRLRVTFGNHDTVHRWFQSYLLGQMQYVWRRLLKSLRVRLTCGVHHGSVLGPLLFNLYTATIDLKSWIEEVFHLFTKSVRWRHSDVRFLLTRQDWCILGEALRVQRCCL